MYILLFLDFVSIIAFRQKNARKTLHPEGWRVLFM
jgi:hypothetical protein